MEWIVEKVQMLALIIAFILLLPLFLAVGVACGVVHLLKWWWKHPSKECGYFKL